MSKDVVIPIVFPDYKITLEIPKTEFDVIPGVDWDNVFSFSYKEKISNLGHAGVLFIDGQLGTTKYYEYGRYDPDSLGWVVKLRNLPDAEINNGEIDPASLKKALSLISKNSGQSGKIEAVYIEAPNAFEAMLEYAERRKSQNANPKRRPYNITSNSCIHFAKGVVEAAKIASPWMIDPRPNSYIGEFQEDYPDLTFDSNRLVIEGLGVF
ncbi:hypothetical protein [Neptunomonas phycophila]|uniref:hypothetical protein n=1 Tax=Neptunomonas phycophila TaxID=1572645 RepID=UPI0030F7BB31